MKDRKCKRCLGGTITCPRCGGSGRPPRIKVPTLYEKHSDSCGECRGMRTLMCPQCGGARFLPPKAVLG